MSAPKIHADQLETDYVPVFAGPPLVICHVASLILLVRGRGRA